MGIPVTTFPSSQSSEIVSADKACAIPEAITSSTSHLTLVWLRVNVTDAAVDLTKISSPSCQAMNVTAELVVRSGTSESTAGEFVNNGGGLSPPLKFAPE